MRILFTPNDKGTPAGLLAHAELHFTEGPLAGLKLIGFSVWQRPGRAGYNVTFPSRVYTVNSEKRSFSLLRPIIDQEAQDRLRAAILVAWDEYAKQAA